MRQQENSSPDGIADYDPNTSTYDLQYNWGNDKTPSHSVVESVAVATENDPERMQPLYEAIDPDALNQIFESGCDGYRRSPNSCVTFRYEGCDVTVHADGRTVVSLLDGDQP